MEILIIIINYQVDNNSRYLILGINDTKSVNFDALPPLTVTWGCRALRRFFQFLFLHLKRL
jgi:hypothetical protein